MSGPLRLATEAGGGYFDGSYPPSIYVPKATGAVAGTPGTWTPAGSTPPATAAQAGGVTATPATPWSDGQYVQGGTAGAPGEMTWTGTGWVGGRAPTALDTSSMTVADVQAYVTEHPDQAAAALASEQAGKARSTLLAWLQTLIDGEAAQPAAEEPTEEV